MLISRVERQTRLRPQKTETPQTRMTTKRGRVAHQQQLAPCAGHAHVHAADVRQKADLALGVAARQRDGNDVALLALKRIDGAHAEPALQQRVMQPSKAPCAPRHALPRHWQNVGLFAWMACPCHFRCVPPRFGSCPCVRPHRLASGPLSYVLQSVHGPAQTRALVRHRLGERLSVNLTSAAECTCSFPSRTRASTSAAR